MCGWDIRLARCMVEWDIWLGPYFDVPTTDKKFLSGLLFCHSSATVLKMS